MTTVGERGSVLVEFALIALVFSLLLATSVDFGRLMFSAQAIQDVARVAARELSVTPLGATLTFEQALADPLVVQRIYDPGYLVVNIDDPATDTDAEIDDYFANMPVVNRALRPLMIVDQPPGGPRLLRYPGALLLDAASPSGFTVGIPRVVARDASGVETIEWIAVIEEIRSDPLDPTTGPFSVAAPVVATQRGLVALRINYPYQAGALSGFQSNPAGPFEPSVDNPIVADDGAVAELNAPLVGTVIPEDPGAPAGPGAYSGPYGLGRQLAFAHTVRPFRKLLSAQAIYRREVFE